MKVFHSKWRKATAVLLLAAVLFWVFPIETIAAEERKFPGDQRPAENYQVGKSSDLYTEKKIEAAIYPLNLILMGIVGGEMFAGGGLAISSQKIFGGVAGGYVVTTGGEKDASSAMVWLNYPPSSFTFDSAEMSTWRVVSSAITNMSTTFINWLANLIFFISKAVVLIANNIIVLCFDSNWVQNSAEWISQGVGEVWKGFTDSNGWLYLFFIFALCGLAISVIFHLLKARVTNALSGVLIAGLCLGGMYIYIGNVHYIVSSISTFTDNIAGVAMSASSIVSPGAGTEGNMTSLQQGITEVTNVAWYANVTCPWSVGQFGTADPNKLQITDEEWIGDGENISSAIEEGYEKEPIPSGKGRRLSYGVLGNMVNEKTLYADTLYLGSDEETRAQILKALSDETLDHGKHDETMFTCSAGTKAAWRHFLASLFSMPPAAAYLILVFFVGGPVILAQLFLLLLLIFLPGALIAGVSGEKGQRVVMAYLKLVLSCFAVKIFNGFFLGTVLFFAATFVQPMLI